MPLPEELREAVAEGRPITVYGRRYQPEQPPVELTGAGWRISVDVVGTMDTSTNRPYRALTTWPEGMPVPSQGDRVALPHAEPSVLGVRVVEWYPLGDVDESDDRAHDPTPFVYVVIGPIHPDRR